MRGGEGRAYAVKAAWSPEPVPIERETMKLRRLRRSLPIGTSCVSADGSLATRAWAVSCTQQATPLHKFTRQSNAASPGGDSGGWRERGVHARWACGSGKQSGARCGRPC